MLILEGVGRSHRVAGLLSKNPTQARRRGGVKCKYWRGAVAEEVVGGELESCGPQGCKRVFGQWALIGKIRGQRN